VARSLDEVLDVLPSDHLEAMLKSLEEMLDAEVNAMLSSGDNVVVHYRRGRASMLKELAGLIRYIREQRRTHHD